MSDTDKRFSQVWQDEGRQSNVSTEQGILEEVAQFVSPVDFESLKLEIAGMRVGDELHLSEDWGIRRTR